MHRLSKHTLYREYRRRPDGNFEKAVTWNSGGSRSRPVLRFEIIIRDPQGRMLKVEKKRSRS